jgi:hypothetical protein
MVFGGFLHPFCRDRVMPAGFISPSPKSCHRDTQTKLGLLHEGAPVRLFQNQRENRLLGIPEAE